jgi:NAD(P)-dependent dehydrogenase (short-subunit alcohol dehydrogenase family)
MASSDQVTTGSPFQADSTGTEVLAGVELGGKVAIVTGGYSGIGLETTRALAAKGATVVVPVRSQTKAASALAGVEGDVRMAPMDLGDLSSVRDFASGMVSALSRLDLLINNAGIMACPERRVGPGWESQFGVCHMGHFALTQGLWSLLTKTAGARVIALSSTAHKFSDIRWDDIQFATSRYSKWRAYGQAKTANALFANALSRRLSDTGGLAFSVHPGAIFTPLQRHLTQDEMVGFGWLDADGTKSERSVSEFKSAQAGCATTLWAATSGLLAEAPGVYCEDCEVASASVEGTQSRYRGVSDHACSDESAERLWGLSESLLAEA